MKIYTRYYPTNNKIESLNLHNYEFRLFDGESKINTWIPLQISRYNVGKKFYDIMYESISNMFFVNKKTAEIFQSSLKEVELLPTISDKTLEEQYFIVNATEVIHEALDRQKSKIIYFSSGRILNVREYVFKSEIKDTIKEKELALFKIGDMDCSPIFYTEKFITLLKEKNISCPFDFKVCCEIE